MRNRLFKLLAKVFDMKFCDIHDSLTKVDVYKWDSLVQMELITGIENEFEVQFSIEDMMAMDSVANIIAILKKYGVSIDAFV